MHIKRGFTIIELLIVIVIIGLLTSVATISFIAAQRNARDNTRKTQVQSIATAVETYYATKRSFPGEMTLATGRNPIADCETTDGDTAKSVRYYYKPDQACSTKDTQTPNRFLPAGSWIPNLGQYLNPTPVGDSYTDDFSDPLTTQTAPLTLVYRHLTNGYAVYAKLEHSSTNDEGILDGSDSVSGNPVLPASIASIPPASWNVYMIRK